MQNFFKGDQRSVRRRTVVELALGERMDAFGQQRLVRTPLSLSIGKRDRIS
jgi:hypothetical protein